MPSAVIARRGGVVLRTAVEEDLPTIDALTAGCYAGIQASFVAQLGEDCYEAVQSEPVAFAHVDTGLDDAHIPARRAYEAVGFDRQVPNVDLWQRL